MDKLVVGADVAEVGEQGERAGDHRADRAHHRHQRGDAERETEAAARALAARRLGLLPGECALVRPDQHVAARFATCAPEPILAAHRKALGR